MNGKRYGYARVSSREQNLDRQLDALEKQGIDTHDIYMDKLSGKNFDRPQYLLLRDHVLRAGDELYIVSVDRLGRSKADTLEELRRFKQNGITVRILDLPTTLLEVDEKNAWAMEMITSILIEVYSSIAQQERETIRKRQREGIDAAQARGKHLGRSRTPIPEGFEQMIDRVDDGMLTATEAMKLLGMKKTTFYRLRREIANRKRAGG